MPIDLLAQSAALFCPYRFLKFNGASGWSCAKTRQMVIVNLGRRAVTFVQDGTVGRICKSAPTIL